MVPYLRAANVKDGRLDLSDVKEMDFTPTEQRVFALKPGDVLVTEGAGSLAAVGASAVWSGELDGTVCFQNTLLRLRPAPGIDPRFLMWWARHAYGSGLFAAAAGGVNIYHLGAETVRALPATVPPLRTQRAIADYLDAEAVRVDELLAGYEGLRAAAASRASNWAANAFNGTEVRVKHLVSRICSGKTPGGGSEVYRTSGVLFVRSMNVRDGVLALDDVAYIDEDTDAEMKSTRVLANDVLLNITGASIGRSAVFHDGLGPANVNQHVAILRPLHGVPSQLLSAALLAPDVQSQIQASQVGANRDGLTYEQVGNLRIRWPAPEAIDRALATVAGASTWRRKTASALGRQIRLLRWRRQALITGAVTGQIEIPGVAA